MTDFKKLAKGEPCQTCFIQDGTVVLAHYSGIRQHSFGKGRGIKGNDLMAAPQCDRCHDCGPFAEGWQIPGYDYLPREIHQLLKSEEQMAQIAKWHLSLEARDLL